LAVERNRAFFVGRKSILMPSSQALKWLGPKAAQGEMPWHKPRKIKVPAG
jgi:hypothetical protein